MKKLIKQQTLKLNFIPFLIFNIKWKSKTSIPHCNVANIFPAQLFCYFFNAAFINRKICFQKKRKREDLKLWILGPSTVLLENANILIKKRCFWASMNALKMQCFLIFQIPSVCIAARQQNSSIKHQTLKYFKNGFRA